MASILGAGIGTLGMIALGALLASMGRPRAGLWAMVTGVLANILFAAVFGIAAFAQPAIGRDYLAGHAAQARLLVNSAVNGGWLNATAGTGVVLLTASVVVFGVAVARSGSLPRAAGVGFAISGPLFVIGSWLDDFIQSIAAALPAPRPREDGRAAAYPNVITVASHTEKDNPAGLPFPSPSRQTTPARPYVLIPSAA